jgi:hypothetical protein
MPCLSHSAVIEFIFLADPPLMFWHTAAALGQHYWLLPVPQAYWMQEAMKARHSAAVTAACCSCCSLCLEKACTRACSTAALQLCLLHHTTATHSLSLLLCLRCTAGAC